MNVGDLGILAGQWGWSRPVGAASAVPEPMSLVVLGLAGLMLPRRRK